MASNRKTPIKKASYQPRTAAERLHRVSEVAEHSVSMRKLQERFPNALTVVDATEAKLLFVTDEDVRLGQPRDPSSCAVAQCAMRVGLGGMIGREFAYLINGTEVTRYHLGKHAQVRTAVFDDRGTMTSGPVMLNPPSPATRLGNINNRVKVHQAAAKRKRPSSRRPSRQRTNQEAEAIRQSIVTYGFRTWDAVS